MGTAFLFFSGQVQGALLLLLSGLFENIWPLPPEVLDNMVCLNLKDNQFKIDFNNI